MLTAILYADYTKSVILRDLTLFIPALEFSTNPHGFEMTNPFLPARLYESFRIYDRPSLPHLEINEFGGVVWEGRLEDPTITGAGVGLRCFGYQNGYRDKRGQYSHAAYSAADSQTIVNDIISSVNTANAFMSSSTALIESPGVTWTETYTRRTPADILDGLAERGDGTLRYEWCVWEGRQLAFRSRGKYGRAWYVDVADINVTRSLENIWNSVYAVYADTVSAGASSAFSQNRYGVKREIAVNPTTDNVTVANNFRDAWLGYYSDPPARGDIEVAKLYDASGALWPLASARSGDTVTIRNLSPTLSSSVDKIRTFTISGTRYRAARGAPPTLTLSPEFGVPVI